jgi:hypothetical protein
MSASSISIFTGFGPNAERIVATSSSRKDWGLLLPVSCPEGLLMAMTWESLKTITEPLHTVAQMRLLFQRNDGSCVDVRANIIHPQTTEKMK